MTSNKAIKITLFVIFLIVALSVVSFSAEKTQFAEKIDLKLMDLPVEDLDFSCFDVNSKGDYLIGFTDYEGSRFNTRSVGKISVYNSDGEFLYGFSFNTEGAFDAFFENGDSSIFLYRENILITLDRLGDLIQVKETAEDSLELGFKTKIVEGITYKAKTGNPLIDNDENASSGKYSMLVKTSAEGQEKLLYENYENGDFDIGILFVIVALFAAIVGVVVVLVVALKFKKI